VRSDNVQRRKGEEEKMNIQVNQLKNGRYQLKIGDEIIMVHEKLSSIVSKIEQYLKMRFLADDKKGGLAGKLQDFLK